MSDEESFVILGTSPMPSITQQSILSGDELGSFHELQHSATELIKAELINQDSQSATSSQKESLSLNASLWKTNAETPAVEVTTTANDKEGDQNGATVENSNHSSMQKSNTTNNNMTNSQLSVGANNKDSLAASFILGEVNADVLKTSVYSQFPSLCSMEACAEDVVKLQSLMSEYVELKNTLTKVNVTMKQFYQKTQQWKDDMQRMEQTYQQQFQECQGQIVTLRNENVELNRDLNSKIDQLTISENLRQKDYDELVQRVSEKTAIIENMRAQIVKLEQQLDSCERIAKNSDDFKEKPDYVDRSEHERVVKDFQRHLSELLARNLDLQDIQKQYNDEINCLKVNLVAAEELIKQHQSEINLLKAEKVENSEALQEYNTERNQIREELALLRQQVDVYSRDFEMERTSRQDLAGEKDQLLQDLRSLQRKNQELIEEAHRHYEEMEKKRVKALTDAPPKVSSPPSDRVEEKPDGHICPICSKTFRNLIILQSHVNDCLDQN